MGMTPSVSPGMTNGVGSPCAAAARSCSGLPSRKDGSVRLPTTGESTPATKLASERGSVALTGCEVVVSMAEIVMMGERTGLSRVLVDKSQHTKPVLRGRGTYMFMPG